MIRGYWSTKDITERFKCSKRTLYRWMDKSQNPFPKPRMLSAGSPNLWIIDDVIEWEARSLNSEVDIPHA